MNSRSRLSRSPIEELEARRVLASTSLSIPTNLAAFQNGIVAVPVTVSPISSGLSKADFAVNYDPSVFTVSSSDVFLGTVPASGLNWKVTAVNQAAGQLGITISTITPTPLYLTIPAGTFDSLIDIDFHVKAGAALGNTAINLAASNSAGPTTTDLFDSNGNPYTISPAPTNGSSDAGVDGSVNVLASAAAPPLGTWSGDAGSGTNVSPLTLAPSAGNPSGIGTMLLLSDGTVMATGGSNNNSQDWYRLTPNNGDYATGTWTSLASMSLMRRFFGSVVLNDGRVMVVGGEYTGTDNNNASDDATAQIYDPATNTWQNTQAFPTGSFGDGQLELLSDGTVLAGYLSNGTSYRYDPTTNNWSTDATMQNGDRPNEESFVKLPDGSILTYEIFGSKPQTGQRFIAGATSPIASAVGTAVTPITITSTNPLPIGLTTGSSVTIVGIAGFAAGNGTFTITVTGANSFTLNGTSGTVGSATAHTGAFAQDQWVAAGNVPVTLATTPVSLSDSIASAVGTAVTPITITSANPLPAALITGASVKISGITGFSAANGTFVITVTGANTFTLNGTTGTVGSGTPSTGSWSQSFVSGDELGPAFLLPDGRIFYIGATNDSAIFNPPTNTWTQGPTIPFGLGANDAPGAVLPNGRILFAASATPAFGPGSNTINPVPVGTSLFEYDPVSNTIAQVTNLPSNFNTSLAGRAAFVTRMLVLPSGQVLITDSSGQPYIYSPAGSPHDSWRPVITGISNNGDGTFTLHGTQLNGLSEGSAYGDDAQNATNYPIVRFQDSGGNVFYAKTFSWSSAGVQTGSTPESTKLTLPAGKNLSDFASATVIANGIASPPATIVTLGTADENVVIRVDPTDSNTIQVLNDGSGVVIATSANNSATPITVFGDGNNNRVVVDETYGNVNAPLSFDGGGSTGAPGDRMIVVGSSGDDSLRLTPIAANSSTMSFNNSALYSFTNINQFAFYGAGGNDTMTVDSTTSLSSVPILYDGANGFQFSGSVGQGEGEFQGHGSFSGGNGFDRLILTQTGGTTQTSDTYSVGPNSGEGTDVIVGGGVTQKIDFQNLAPVQDNVPVVTQTVNGTPADNAINYAQGPGGGIFGADTTGLVTIDNQESYEFSQKQNLVVNGQAGNDTMNLNFPTSKPTGLTTITVNGNDGDDTITTRSGVTVPVTFNGGAGNDTLDASGVNAATATLNGNDGNDTLIGSTAAGSNNTFDGGLGDDTILLKGTSASDHISVSQTAVGAYTSSVNGVAHNDVFSNVEEFQIAGGDGGDVILVTPGDLLALNLHFTVDGGNGFDQLAVRDAGTGDLLLYRKGATADSGSVTVGPANASPAVVDFTGIDFVNPLPATGGKVVVFPFDTFESNNFMSDAFDLGAPTTTTINASLDPGSDAFFGLPGDSDWFKVEANVTGTLDFQLFFSQIASVVSGRPGLPGNGDLDLDVFDAAGNLISSSTSANNNERVRIPAVQGQAYFVEIVGVGAAINGYSLTVINTAPPVPFNLELSRSVAVGIAGAPNTGDLPLDAVNSDTGRSQFDNVTDTSLPTIYVRLNDAILLNDLPGNGTSNSPPDHVIPIPFSATGVTAGYRIAIFDGDNTSTPVPAGFASPVAGFQGLYQFTFTTPLSNGLHHLVSRVQMVDGATPQETGFGDHSLSLDIIVDTAPPPVRFGIVSVSGTSTGLSGASDSGALGATDSFTLADRITNVTVPTFYGTGEANSIVKLYAIDKNGNPVLLGQTTATPLDGTNADPNGQWTITSTISLNDPKFFNYDGLRRLFVTAEDLAGNISQPNADHPTARLNIFLDTQGPQIGDGPNQAQPPIQIITTNNTLSNYNLFALKPQNAPSGPTPLVYGLNISVVDNPSRDPADFPLDPAVLADIAQQPGQFELVGDSTGVIAIDPSQITVTNNPLVAGQPATATISFKFTQPLPDDRYTLTIKDTAIVDAAGNKLDGESNAIEPNGSPVFPSGDGQPGGKFVARFTVDSRPEMATYAAGSVYADINGNSTWDPTNTDATNRDLTFTLGIVPSLQGKISPMGIHDAVFAGNFVGNTEETRQGLPLVGQSKSGFDKLAAYGYDPIVGAFRWLIDVDNSAVIDPALGDFANVQPAGFQINGVPVAGDFDGNKATGDEIGLFNGTTWYFDTANHHVIDGTATVVQSQLRGAPVVGDFNGDGVIDLATYNNGVFQINFGSLVAGKPAWSGQVNATINFGFAGVGGIPIAADMNQDGTTDLGLFEPRTSGVNTPAGTAEWYWLISNAQTGLNHPFSPTPIGNDLFAQFGNQTALPIVGNFDPPAQTQSAPAATDVGAVLGSINVAGQTVQGQQWYSFSPLRDGTISVGATATSATAAYGLSLYTTNLDLLATGYGDGQGQIKLNASVAANSQYLVRLTGNGAAVDLNFANHIDQQTLADTNRDGHLSPYDVLLIVNDLIAHGSHATNLTPGNSELYCDTNLDAMISPADALGVINALNASPAAAGATAAPTASTSAAPASSPSPAPDLTGVSSALVASSAATPASTVPSSNAVATDAVFASLATSASPTTAAVNVQSQTAPSAPAPSSSAVRKPNSKPGLTAVDASGDES